MGIRFPKASRLPYVIRDLNSHFETRGIPNPNIVFDDNPHPNSTKPRVLYSFSDDFRPIDGPDAHFRYQINFGYSYHPVKPLFSVEIHLNQAHPNGLRNMLSWSHLHVPGSARHPVEEYRYEHPSPGLLNALLRAFTPRAPDIPLNLPPVIEKKFFSFLSDHFGRNSVFASSENLAPSDSEAELEARHAIVRWLRSLG